MNKIDDDHVVTGLAINDEMPAFANVKQIGRGLLVRYQDGAGPPARRLAAGQRPASDGQLISISFGLGKPEMLDSPIKYIDEPVLRPWG